MTDPRRRRTYLVDRPFQLKFILGAMVAGALVTALVGLWTYETQLHALEGAALDPVHRGAVHQAARQMLWAMGGISVLSVLGVGAFGFVMSHRLAGPVHVLSYFLDLLAEGRYPPPRALRRHDQLKEFYAHFLATVERMKIREQQHLQHIDEAVARSRSALLEVPDSPPALQALQALQVLEVDAGKRRGALNEASPAAAPPPLPAEVA